MLQRKDIEVEFLLKEYEKLNNEIISRETTRAQLTAIAIVLVGGIITAIPFLLTSDAHGLQLRLPPIYIIFLLLTVNLLFTSLQCTHLLHDFEVGCTANYLDQCIRARVCQLLQIKEDEAKVVNWDRYHLEILFASSLSWIRILDVSRYVIMFMPALLSLLAAGLVYVSYFSILTASGLGWIALGFFIFDFFYLLSIVPAYRYVQHVYQKVPHLKP